VFLALLTVITGMFKEFIIFTAIILIHELGHYLMALYYKWDIDRIYLYPFGGFVKFNVAINKPIKEEFNILVMGLLFQIIFYLLLLFLHDLHFIRTSTIGVVKNYHYSILLFNLIPIFPLDGSKLLNLIFSIKLPFKLSHKITVYMSYIFIIGLTYIIINYYLNINLLLMIFLLLTRTIEQSKAHDSIFNKFLLERYLNKFSFRKVKYLNNYNVSNMTRDKRHLFRINNEYISEKEMLRKRYKGNR